MEILIYVILIVAVCVGTKLLFLYLKYNQSQYKNISGNQFLQTIFNTGNNGEFLTFCILEQVGQTNILTNIYLPKKRWYNYGNRFTCGYNLWHICV